MQEKRDLYFALLNKGPVKVVLRGWGGNITGACFSSTSFLLLQYMDGIFLVLSPAKELFLNGQFQLIPYSSIAIIVSVN
jgi:hypothetical protein